jgi:ketosteroid isomerase-like protein
MLDADESRSASFIARRSREVPCAKSAGISPGQFGASNRAETDERGEAEHPLSLTLSAGRADTWQAMSQENIDLLRRAYEYVQRTGEVLPEAVHPDFVWDATTIRGGMQPETCVGVDETNRWLAEWLDVFDNWSIEIEEVIDAGDQAVTFVRQRGNPRHGGPETEMRLAQVWTFRDGRISRMEMYADRAEALQAAGLKG